MGMLHQHFALFLLAVSLASIVPATAQVPNTLLHSLFDPSPGTIPQAEAAQGFSVAVDGNIAVSGARLVVGAIYDDTSTNDAGIAYVFELSSTTPTVPVATLTNPSPASYDVFGSSVAVSGTRVVIGAYQDNTGASDAGIAYVYDLASVTPTVPVATLTNPSPVASDRFGYSVSVSGARVVVGALSDDTGATDTGISYVYDLASATPTVPVTTLTNPTPAMGDGFGSAVGISDMIVVIGSPYDDTVGTNTGNPTPVRSDVFGSSVCVDGTTVVVGAPNDDTIAADPGAAYIYGPTPALNIVPAAPGFATISWTPATSSGFVLQRTDSLAPTNWVAAPSGAANPSTIPATNASRFYRLFQP